MVCDLSFGIIMLRRVCLIFTIVKFIVHNFLNGSFVGDTSGLHPCSCETIESVKAGALRFFK